MNLPRLSLRYPTVVIAFVIALTGLGLITFATMPRRADPAFTIRTCQVFTAWPGVDAERVEKLVTFPLEEEINRLEEVDIVRSISTPGQSVIFVELEPTMPVGDIQETWEKVRAKIDVVRPNLPQGVMDPIVDDDFGDTSVMLLALFEKRVQRGEEPKYTPRQLEIVADRLRERIALLDGVARAESNGVREERLFLETTRANWANTTLTIDEVERYLQARNIAAPGGRIDGTLSRLGLWVSGEFYTADQIEDEVVSRTPAGAPILIRDLGLTVRRDYEDPPSKLARYGGPGGVAPCIVVSFTMKDGVKVTDIGAAVRQLVIDMQEHDKTIPPDIGVEVVFDEAEFVDFKISSFVTNLIQSIVIVLAVAFLLAGTRSALVMAAAIPFTMIISIGIAAKLGIELEQMSIASLIIALGLLVDNAVVVSDNTRRYMGLVEDRTEAVARGVEQVMFPVLAGTLTTVFAFLPMAFLLTGEKKEYVYSVPTVVSITLLTSWLLALTQTTLMAKWLIRPAGENGATVPIMRLGSLIGRVLRRGRSESGPSFTDRYATTIRAFLRVKVLVIVGAVVLLMGALRLPVGSQFFPDDARDYMYVDIWLPEGSSLKLTDEIAREVETIMCECSRGDSETFQGERLDRFYSSVGGSGARFALGVNPEPPASNFAQIIARTTDSSITNEYIADLRRAVESRVAGARIIPRKLALGPPVDSPLAIRITGKGFSEPGFGSEVELRRQAERVKEVFRGLDDVYDVHDDWGERGYQIDVQVDQERARVAGVTSASLAKSLNAYFSGHYLTTFREGDHRVPLYLRLVPEERTKIENERTVFVEGAAGKVPIDAVADVSPRFETTRIQRRERNRVIEARAKVEPGILANDKLAEAMPALNEIERTLPPGFSFEIAGELGETEEAQGEMMLSFGVGLLLIVLCLIVQYNSMAKVLMILMTVPLGAIGAFTGLWLTGNAMGFMPMLGFVSLMGIVVNSGILYIAFAEDLIREKLERGEGLAGPGDRGVNGLTREAFRECLAEAGEARLLPIFLTSCTTIGGLFTLALFGGPMWEGMAWLLIFGLAVGTVLTLLVLPSIYAFFAENLRLRLVRVEPPIGTPAEPKAELAASVGEST